MLRETRARELDCQGIAATKEEAMANPDHVRAFREGNAAIERLLVRLEQSGEALDLEGARLGGRQRLTVGGVIGHSIGVANLRRAQLRNIDFMNMRLGTVEADERTRLMGCNLTSTSIGIAQLGGAHLDDCNLDLGTVLDNADLSGAQFSNCNLRSVTLVRASFVGAPIRSTTFVDCRLYGTNFTRARLSRSKFQRCHFSQPTYDQVVSDLGKNKVNQSFVRRNLFLSYHDKREKLVDMLKGLLDERAFSYVDKTNLQGGDSLSVKILSELKKIKVLVAILTRKHPLKKGSDTPSPWVLDETAAAAAFGKVIKRVSGFGIHKDFRCHLVPDDVKDFPVCNRRDLCRRRDGVETPCRYEKCRKWRNRFAELLKDLQNDKRLEESP